MSYLDHVVRCEFCNGPIHVNDGGCYCPVCVYKEIKARYLKQNSTEPNNEF